MEEKNLLIGAATLLILAARGVLAINILFMNNTSSTLPAVGEEASISACESALDSQIQLMEQRETREIPASCFQNEEPVTDRISGAEPRDTFRKTESGIEVVK